MSVRSNALFLDTIENNSCVICFRFSCSAIIVVDVVVGSLLLLSTRILESTEDDVDDESIDHEGESVLLVVVLVDNVF